MKQLVERVPVLEPLLAKANHVDVKTIDSMTDMRTFIAGMLSYTPFWLKFLYGVRWLFVRLLGMRQEGIPLARPLRPTDISLTPGDPATFFTVMMAEPEKYWVAEAADCLHWGSGRTAHPGQSLSRGYHRPLSPLDRAGVF
jgi:hypothetical protein